MSAAPCLHGYCAGHRGKQKAKLESSRFRLKAEKNRFSAGISYELLLAIQKLLKGSGNDFKSSAQEIGQALTESV